MTSVDTCLAVKWPGGVETIIIGMKYTKIFYEAYFQGFDMCNRIGCTLKRERDCMKIACLKSPSYP